MSIPERPSPVRSSNVDAATDQVSIATGIAKAASAAQPTKHKEQPDAFVLPVVQEQLQVARRTFITGGVRIRKEVDAREQILDQPLRSEEVHVDRLALDPPLAVGAAPAVRHEGETMIVSVVEERLVVEKRLFVIEELHITRRRKMRHAPQRVVLRSERVIVERFNAPATTAAPQTVSDIETKAGDNMRSNKQEVFMQSTTERTLVGVFDSNEQAQAARNALRDAGIPEDRVHVKSGTMADALSDSSARVRKDETSYGSNSDEQDPPGFFARLFGAADAEPEHIQQYSEAVRRGSCVVVVDSISEDRVKAASDVLARCGAVDIDERAAKWRERGWQGYDESAPKLSDAEIEQERAYYGNARNTDHSVEEGNTRIPVIEEQMQVGKREVQGGGVRVYTRITERPVEENVTLREERARVERRPVDREATEADLGTAFKEGSIELRETSEEAVVSKTARVVEEVDVSKEKSERTETIRDSVRRSDVEVEDLPGSRIKATDQTSGTRKGKNS